MRPAFRLAVVPLSLLALLAPARALAVETELAGKPLVIDVTNTSIINYHFNNRNTKDGNISTLLDDDYGEWLDRLNVQVSWWKLHAGVRIDAATFFATPSAARLRDFATVAQPTDLQKRIDFENQLYGDLHTRFLRAYYPSKLFVGFSQPGVDITVGDFYAQLGRGLVFSARKIDELAVDTTVRGVKVAADHNFGDFRLAGTFFVGQMNPLRIDETSGRRLHGDGSPLFFGFPSAGDLSTYNYDMTTGKPVLSTIPGRPSYLEDTVLGAHVEGGTKRFVLGGNTSVLARTSHTEEYLRCTGDNPKAVCAHQSPEFDSNNNPALAHNTIVTYSGSLSIPSIAKHGDLYVEVAGQSLRDGHLRSLADGGTPANKDADSSGHAIYASASFNAGPVAVSLEGKSYRNFFPLSANIDTGNKAFGAPEYSLIAYNQVPIVDPTYTEPVSGGSPNVCIDGGRGRVDYRFNRGASVYAWLGRSTSWTEQPGRNDAICTINEITRTDTWDTAIGTELALEGGKSHVRAWVGARTTSLPVPTEAGPLGGLTSTFYREGYIRYDLSKHLTERFSLQMQGFHRRRYEPFTYGEAWTEGENYTALQWSPHLSAVFGYEYEYKPTTGCRSSYHDAQGFHAGADLCHYLNGGITFRANVGEQGTPTERVLGHIFDTVNVFVGQRRGATRCVSGVCRQFPPFEGAKLEITSRF
ncbi:MAG: hypothetical protein ABJE95_22890 [Byssovorax sp.]